MVVFGGGRWGGGVGWWEAAVVVVSRRRRRRGGGGGERVEGEKKGKKKKKKKKKKNIGCLDCFNRMPLLLSLSLLSLSPTHNSPPYHHFSCLRVVDQRRHRAEHLREAQRDEPAVGDGVRERRRQCLEPGDAVGDKARLVGRSFVFVCASSRGGGRRSSSGSGSCDGRALRRE